MPWAGIAGKYSKAMPTNTQQGGTVGFAIGLFSTVPDLMLYGCLNEPKAFLSGPRTSEWATLGCVQTYRT